MKILASEKLSAHRFKTNEGYLICTNAIIARTGEQEYLESELNPSSMSQEVVKCYRPEEEVFAPETIASFENKPLTFHHPQEDVDTENYERLAIGFVRDVHREGNNLVANIIVNKQDAIDAIENGELEELSCGYDCEIIKEGDHYVQKDIRGNHVALVEAGRAGNARIIDSAINDANKKLEHIIEYFDTWGYPSRSELQEAVNFYELSKSDVEKVFGKKYNKSELMKLHTHDAAIQDSRKVYYIYNDDNDNWGPFNSVAEARQKIRELKKFDKEQGNPFDEVYRIEAEMEDCDIHDSLLNTLVKAWRRQNE